jgi:type IV pilus assembly protein PilW
MMSRVSGASRPVRKAHGISLIDLMVGLAIGLTVTVITLQVAVMFDARRRIAGGSADANMNATHVLASLVRELRIAGSGLGPLDALGCDVHRAATGQSEAIIAWRPLTIVNGEDGLPDTFTSLAAGSELTAPARLIAPYSLNDSDMMLDTTLGLAAGDRFVLQSAGNPNCVMLTAATVRTGGYALSPTALTGVLPGAVFGPGSAAIKVGPLRYRRYAVDASQRLQVNSFDLGSGRWAGTALADGVVNLQLQYGFDVRPGTQAVPQVSSWSDVPVDADGNGTVGDAADWRRLLGVRIAVVTRSAQRRNDGCNATAPQWQAGQPPTGALQTTAIKVDHLPDWRCWRYRVLQAEVPLRNQLWRDG